VSVTQVTAGGVKLGWTASSDNVGVAGYTIYRDGTVVDTVGGSTLTYSDTTTRPSTSYAYTVDAFDNVGNHSDPSQPAMITTRPNDITTTLVTVADAFVQSTSANTNFGTSSSLKVDADGVFTSYLRFVIPPTGGSIVSASLRIFPTSSQTPGYDVYSVSDDSWSETGIKWNNAPAMSGTKAGSSGRVTANTVTAVDITSLIDDALLNNGGRLNLGLATTGTTALTLSSRQGANPPQLLVVSTAPPPDSTPPTTPSGVTAAQDASGNVRVAWNASTDNTGVDGYTVFRDSVALATVAGTSLTYLDSAIQPGTTYTYAVDAFDSASNHSPLSSPPVTLTTRTTTVTTTLVPVADAYVQSGTSAGSNFGSATTLKVDADGIMKSYIRFSIPALNGSLVSAVLRVYPNSSQNTGYAVYPVNPQTPAWTETGVTWNNAPSLGTTSAGSSGKATVNTWTEVDISSLLSTAAINAGGTFEVGLTTSNNTALSLSSRQGANPPQLVITSG
jgi:hypothetical protein